MEEIVGVHFPDIQNNLVQEAMKVFYSLREIDEFRKKPTTSELIDWMKALLAGGIPINSISKQVPFVSALLKKETDYDFFTKNYLPGLAGDYILRKS